MDRIIPVAVEAARAEMDLRHLFIRDLPALRVLALVNLGPHPQTGLGSGCGDQVHDGWLWYGNHWFDVC